VFEGDKDDHEVEAEVDGDQPDRDPDGLGEASEEDRGQQRDEEQGDADLVAFQDAGHEGVLEHVGGGVGGRQGDGDYEVGGHEAEQRQHQYLARPPRQQPLQHGDRALAVGALLGHPAVDREGAEQRQQHQHERGDGRQDAGGQGRDARLVAQRGEVVNAGQAHDLPPGVLVALCLLLPVGARMPGLLGQVLEQPAPQRAPAPVLGSLQPRGGQVLLPRRTTGSPGRLRHRDPERRRPTTPPRQRLHSQGSGRSK
jgi:hypothetical protein